MKKCPYCGEELRDDEFYCFACGKEYIESVATDLTKCSFCGTKLVEGARYCLHCGEPVYGGFNPYKEYDST